MKNLVEEKKDVNKLQKLKWKNILISENLTLKIYKIYDIKI